MNFKKICEENKVKKKKCLPILLAVWPYLVTTLMLLISSDGSGFWGLAIGISIVLTTLVYVLNIVNACTYKDENADSQLAFWNMLIKLIHIPFYLILFIIGVLLLCAMVVPALIFVTPIIDVVLVIISFFLMITSSVYGISAVLRAKRKGKVSITFVVVNIILHLFFVADVISAIVVFVKVKKRSKSENPYSVNYVDGTGGDECEITN